MKIGFIGLGNMATAMIGGMLQKGIAKPEDIIGSSKTETTAEKVKTKFNIKIGRASCRERVCLYV